MIKYLIIDDEYIAHDIIKGYCDFLPSLELQKSCYDAIEALEYIGRNEVDLIFLDLNMPKLKGFEFLKTLSSPPKVIVTTAYKEYALEGYELEVVDYLLKPFSFERFLKAVNKTLNITNQPQLVSTIQKKESESSIFLRSNKKYIQVFLNSILYIEASGNYTKVISSDQVITIREKISDLIKLLPKQDFLQVHKSFAIAIKHINSIEGNRIQIHNYTIPIGKMYKLQVQKIL